MKNKLFPFLGLLILCLCFSKGALSQIIECSQKELAHYNQDSPEIKYESCKECENLMIDVSSCEKSALEYSCIKDESDGGQKRLKETKIRRDTGEAVASYFYQSADKMRYRGTSRKYNNCRISKIQPKF